MGLSTRVYIDGNEQQARAIEAWLAVPGNAVEVAGPDGRAVVVCETSEELVAAFRANLALTDPPDLRLRFGTVR